MTISRLSEKTEISSIYVERIEAGEFGNLPGRSYVGGFTRSFCLALDLDHEGI